MFTKKSIALGLLTTVAVLSQTPAIAQDAAKDPKTGKNCVSFISSELTNTGQTRMNYRNTCATAFQIQIQAGDNVRQKGIEAGTPEKPAKAYVTCKPDE